MSTKRKSKLQDVLGGHSADEVAAARRGRQRRCYSASGPNETDGVGRQPGLGSPECRVYDQYAIRFRARPGAAHSKQGVSLEKRAHSDAWRQTALGKRGIKGRAPVPVAARMPPAHREAAGWNAQTLMARTEAAGHCCVVLGTADRQHL